LLKYPNLKIALAEGGIGWIPYFLERADFTFHHHGPWTRCDFGGKLPSQVFREHFIVCFIDDHFGCHNLDDVGEKIVAYELDYPHSDCTWPNVAEALWTNVQHLPRATVDRITHGNAFRTYGIYPFATLGRENCTVEALRAKARGVDVTEASYGGMDARGFGDPKRPVTARDVWQTYRGSKV
jgi:hypothetical protein